MTIKNKNIISLEFCLYEKNTKNAVISINVHNAAVH